MITTTLKCLIVTAVLGLITLPAVGQITVGPKVGFTLTWLQNDGLPEGARIRLRRGLQAGGFLNVPFATYWSFQPELLYTQKGQRIRYTEEGFSFEPLPHAFQNRLHYVELPLLMKYALSDQEETWRGYLLAGPSLGYWFAASYQDIRPGPNESSTSEVRKTITKTVINLKQPVDGQGVARLEVGAIIGGGVTYQSAIGPITVDARVIAGITSPAIGSSGGGAPLNRGIVLSLGYAFQID